MAMKEFSGWQYSSAVWAEWEWECNLKLRISNYEFQKASLYLERSLF